MTSNTTKVGHKKAPLLNSAFLFAFVWQFIAVASCVAIASAFDPLDAAVIIGISTAMSLLLAIAFKLPNMSRATVFFWCMAILCAVPALTLPLAMMID